MNRDVILTIAALLLALSTVPVAAETGMADAGAEAILFQDIPAVFAASKYEQRLEEAPSSVSLITAEEIKRNGYRTLADILRSVRGLYVSYDRNYSYLGVRGFSRPTDYNSRVLVMIDGHRTNENIYHMAMIGTEGILDVDLIERVEVVRGPSSSLYGTSALFAVVNIISKRGRDYKGMEAAGEVGSLNTRKARVTYGNRSADGTEALASFTGYASDGHARLYYPEFDAPATNNGVAENLDADEAHNAFLKITRGDFVVTGGYMRRAKDVPTASYDANFNDPHQSTVDKQAFVSLDYDTELNATSRVSASLSYNSYRYDGTYANPASGGLYTRDYGYGQWWTTELQYTTRIAEQHRVIVGVDFQNNARQSQGNYEVSPYTFYFTDERSSHRWSVFTQDEWRLHRNLILNAGVRHDEYSEWGNSTNPRLALIYLITPTTTGKLLYGSAFRAPSPYELYYTPSPWLQPETIRTTELVLEHAVSRNLRAVASLFHYSMQNLIDQQPDYSFRNTGDATASGVEVELDGRFTTWLEGRVSYAYQEAEDSSTGAWLSNSPRNLAKLNLNVPFIPDKLYAGFELQYTSERRTLGGGETKPFMIGNFTLLARHLARGLELSASVYNVGDIRYTDPAGIEHAQDVIPQDGRSWRLKARYQF